MQIYLCREVVVQIPMEQSSPTAKHKTSPQLLQADQCSIHAVRESDPKCTDAERVRSPVCFSEDVGDVLCSGRGL